MITQEDFKREYLVLNLKDEESPMLIKLISSRDTICTQTDVLIRPSSDGLVFTFKTGFFERPEKKIEGLNLFNPITTDEYTHHRVELIVSYNKLRNFSIEWLDDNSSYIHACRAYYTTKYGVSYIKK